MPCPFRRTDDLRTTATLVPRSSFRCGAPLALSWVFLRTFEPGLGDERRGLIMLHAAARGFFPDVLPSPQTYSPHVTRTRAIQASGTLWCKVTSRDTLSAISNKFSHVCSAAVSLYSGGDLGPYRVLKSFCSQSAVTPATILAFLMRAATILSNTSAEPHSEHRQRRSFAHSRVKRRTARHGSYSRIELYDTAQPNDLTNHRRNIHARAFFLLRRHQLFTASTRTELQY